MTEPQSASFVRTLNEVFGLHIAYAFDCHWQEKNSPPSEHTDKPKFTGAQVRFLYALQIVTSLVALPIITCIGLCESAFRAITFDGAKALSALQDTMTTLTIHTFAIIPFSVVGICASAETTLEIGESFQHFIEKIANVWNCTCCQSEQTS